MGRTRTYKLFRETKTKVLNITTSFIMVASSLGGALPIFLSQQAFAASPAIDHIVFTTSVQTVTAGTASDTITIQTQNHGNRSAALNTSNNTLSVTSDSGTGEFAETSGNTWSTTGSFTMANGTANRSFIYEDSTTGTHTLTATLSADNGAETWSATQSITVNASTPAPNVTITSLTPGSGENYADYVGTTGFMATVSTTNATLDFNSPNDMRFTVTPDNAALHAAQYAEGTYGGGAKGSPDGVTFSSDPSIQQVMEDTGMNLGDTFKLTVNVSSNGTPYTLSSDHVQLGTAPAPVDTIKPSIAIVSPTDFSRPFKVGPSVTISATDADSGVASTLVHVYNSDNTAALFCPVSHTASTTCDLSSLGTGDYYMKLGATDNAGNSQIITQPLTIDKIAPQVSVTPADGSLLHGTETFDITVTDNNALDTTQNKSVWVYLYNTAGTQKSSGAKVDLSSGHGSFTVDTTKFDDDTANLDVGIVYDAAGNASGTSDNYFRDFTVDNIRPVVRFTQAPSSFVRGDFDVTATITDANGIDLSSVFLQAEDLGTNARAAKCVAGTLTVTPTLPTQATLHCTIDTSALQEGYTHYIVWAWGKDLAGNSSSNIMGQSEIPFVVDRTAPAAPAITAPVNEQWFNGTPITDSWSAVSDPSGIDHYQIAYRYDDGHTFGGSTCAGEQIGGQDLSGCRDVNGTSRSHVPSLNEEGGVTIWVRAIDGAGNVGAWSTPVHYHYDHTDPTIVLSSPADGSFVSTLKTSGQITIQGEFTDNLYANYADLYLVKDGVLQSVAITYGTHAASSTLATFDANALHLSDGTYTLQGVATDLAGNSAQSTITFTLDNTRPTISFLNPTDFSKPFRLGPNLEIKTNDVNGITSTALHVYKSNGTPALFCPTTSGDTTSCDTASLTSGDYYVLAGAVDSAGNNQTVRQDFTIDNIRPNASITAPSDDSYLNSGDFTVEGMATDNETAIDHVNIYVTKQNDDGSFGGYAVNNQLAQYDSTTHAFSYAVSGLADGNYTIKAVAYDLAGNYHFANTVHVSIDTVHPTVTFRSPSDFSSPFKGGPNVIVDASDDGSGLNVFVTHVYNAANDSPAQFCTASTAELAAGSMSCDLSGLSDGTYYIKAGTNDKAGNNATINSGDFTIDTTAPALTINPYTGTDTTPTLTGTTDVDPAVVITVALDGGMAQTATNNGDGTWSFPVTSPLTIGTHDISVTATDGAGNTTPRMATVTVTHTLAPRHVSLATQTNGGNSGGTTVTITPNNSGQVLGANTTTPNKSNSSSDQNDGNNGKVKGDNTVKLQNASDKNGGQFLGLGWWWLLILAAVLGFGWVFLAYRRSDKD